MATYTSLQLTPPKYPVSGPGIGGRTLHAIQGDVTFTSAPALNDTFPLFDLHPNFRVMGGYIEASDMDTNGTPTITLDVGDAADPDRYFAASTAAQAGVPATALAATGLGYLNTAKTRVYGTVKAAPATGATGTVSVVLYGTIQEPA